MSLASLELGLKPEDLLQPEHPKQLGAVILPLPVKTKRSNSLLDISSQHARG